MQFTVLRCKSQVFLTLFLFSFINVSLIKAVPKVLWPKSFEMNFLQQFIGEVSGTKKSTQGSLRYLYPGHLYLDITSPEEQQMTFVQNKQRSWQFIPSVIPGEESEVIERRSSPHFLLSFFDTLVDGEEGKFKVVDKGKEILYQFDPALWEKVGFQEAVLYLRERKEEISLSDINKIHFKKSNNQVISLSITLEKHNFSFKQQDFVFKAPKNSRVIKK